MPVECEAKIKVQDPARLKARLAELAAEFVGEGPERNWVLDDAAGSLLEREILLRVRNTGGDAGVLTVKRKTVAGAFKTREEIETRTNSAVALLQQLETVGFRVVWIYEKFRSTWRQGGCVVTLDSLPELGDYAEIEGAAERIPAVARGLGLDPDAHIEGSYLDLWVRHLEARGEARRHMTFATPAGQELRQGQQTT